MRPALGRVFTPEETHRGAVAGGQATAAMVERRAVRACEIATLVDAVESGQIGQQAMRTALIAIDKTTQILEQLDGTTSLDAVRTAQVAKDLTMIGRLLTGQSTQNVAHGSVSVVESQTRLLAAEAKLAQLRAGSEPA